MSEEKPIRAIRDLYMARTHRDVPSDDATSVAREQMREALEDPVDREMTRDIYLDEMASRCAALALRMVAETNAPVPPNLSRRTRMSAG